MPERCKCCSHPKRAEINEKILKLGESDGSIAQVYGMSREAVRRHRNRHLSFSPQAATEAHNVRTIIGFATDLHQRAAGLLERAEVLLEPGSMDSRSVQAVAASLRELRASIELLAKLIVSSDQPNENASMNAELDAKITLALSTVTLPELGAGDIIEAEIVLDH